MAYTSDLTERWGGEWLAWDECGQFWAQALRGVVRKTDTEGLQVNQTESSGDWNLRITRNSPNGTPISDINWEAAALDENGQLQELPVKQTGLGSYQMKLSLANHQRLTLRLRDRDHDKLKVLHYHRPYPAEYRLSRELPPVLSALSSVTPETIREGILPQPRRMAIEHYAYFAALLFLVASIVVRRI